MQYYHYTLHPEIDNYFYYTYNKYVTRPLFQKVFSLGNIYENKNPAQHHKKLIKMNNHFVEIPTSPDSSFGLLPIRFKAQGYGSISSDIFIKLGNIPPMAVFQITVKKDTAFPPFYNIDWITVFLYNMRCHPEFVSKNMFILPNLVLLATNPQDYIFEIVFTEKGLCQYCINPWRASVFSMLPCPTVISQLIMEYTSDHITIDIWHRSSPFKHSNYSIHEENRVINMLYAAKKNIYMQNYFVSINPHFVSIQNGYAQINLHKNILRDKILFTVIAADVKRGTWVTMDVFERLIVKDGSVQLLEKNLIDFNMTPSLAKYHYVNKTGPAIKHPSTIPVKFNLTENITMAGNHPHMYRLDLNDSICQNLIMNDDNIDEIDDMVSVEFYVAPCNKLAYIYLEISKGQWGTTGEI